MTAPEQSAEKAQQPMWVPHVPDEAMLRLTTPQGETTEWVNRATFEQVQQIAFDLRRTLSLVHMLLAFGHNGDAYDRVMRDTGLTIEDARAMRGLVSEVQSWTSSTSPGQQDPR